MNQTIVYDNLLIIIKQKDGLAAQERLYRLTKISDFKLNLEYKFPQEYNNTLLICAAKYGLNNLAHELIMMGADVHAVGDQNFTALHCAARFGHILIVDYLLRAKAGVNVLTTSCDTPLHFAAYYGFANVIRLLIKWEADVNAQNKNGMTPLHFAARQGHEDAVKILIKQKHIDLTGGKKVIASPLQIAKKKWTYQDRKHIN